MSFALHGDNVECRTFGDFYRWIMFNPERRICPDTDCGNIMDMRMYPTFNMDKYGRAIFYCQNKECEFSQKPIIIEAKGGKGHGLEPIHFPKHPGNYR